MADQVELYYEDFGNGSPIVFTNAGNLTHKMWMGQVAALASGFRTVTYDNSRHRLVLESRAAITAEAAAADLCALVERMDLGRVTLDMGQIEELNTFNQALSKFVHDVATMAQLSGWPGRFCGTRRERL